MISDTLLGGERVKGLYVVGTDDDWSYGDAGFEVGSSVELTAEIHSPR